MEHLIEDVSLYGSIEDMPLEVKDSRGQMVPITVSATATYDDEHNFVGTEHLLLGIVRDTSGVAAGVLTNHGADFESLREEIISLLGTGD